MFKRNKLKMIHEKLKKNSGSNTEQTPSPGSSEQENQGRVMRKPALIHDWGGRYRYFELVCL